MGLSFRSQRLVLSLGLPALACGSAVADAAATTGGSTSQGASTTGPSLGTSTSVEPTTSAGPADSSIGSSPSGSSGVEESGMETASHLFDVGAIPDLLVSKEGCNKVDFLFVIDDSSSMAAYQANLVANFPAFIDGIQNALENAYSYQVGVVTTDAYAFNVPECQELSSLVVRTGGVSSSNMVCGPYADGANYMTDNDDLVEAFSCAATVGVSGSGNEQPLAAVSETLLKLEGDPGECNDGFIRDDALLVIVIIGDEFDNSPGTEMQYYQDVVTAKFDLPENVVVVSICDFPGNICGFGASVEVSAFTDLWGANGFKVPICVADYAPYFEEAIDIIDVACENYISPAG
jgi:hypothetical protein